MKPIFDDETLYAALEDANGEAARAAQAVGCSPATMFAFKRRIGYGAPVVAPMPAPAPVQVAPVAPVAPIYVAPPPPPPAPIVAPAPAPVVMAQLHRTTTDGVDRSAFDVPCDEIPDPPPPIDGWIERDYYRDLVGLLDAGEPVLMIGHAGGGKTMSARQYAATRGLPFIRVSMENSADLRSKFGRMSVIADNGAPRTVFVESQLTALCERGEGAVLLLDEINMVDAGRLAIVNELLDSRTYYMQEARGGRGRTLHLPDAVRIVAACNPPLAQFAGAQRLNAALANRFTAHIQVPPLDDHDIAALAKHYDVPTKARAMIVKLMSQAQRMVIEQGLRVQVSIRSLRAIAVMLRQGMPVARAVEYAVMSPCVSTGDTTGREALAGLIRAVIGDLDSASTARKARA